MEKKEDNLQKKKSYFEYEFISEYKNNVLNALWEKEVFEIIKNKSIVVDINMKKVFHWWDKKTEIHLNTVSWLPENMQIKNPDVLIQFCKIHWFFPIIRNIYIDDLDISKIKELPEIMSLFAWIIRKWDINFALYSEINKIIDSLEEEKWISFYDIADFYYIFYVFASIRKVWFHDIIKTFGKNLEKNKNPGTFSENIFCEVALRLENEIRDTFGIYSTYLNLASMREDVNDKTDMQLTLNIWKNKSLEYKDIPIQFTTSYLKPENTEIKTKKIDWIEKRLLKGESNERINLPFVVMFVNWSFGNEINYWNFLWEYKEWVDKKSIRQQQSTSKFPFFINTLHKQNLIAPKVGYIVLNVLFMLIEFKWIWKWKKQKTSHLKNIQEQIDNFLETMKWKKIWWVFVDKIWIQITDIVNVQDPNPKKNWNLTAYNINYYYKWNTLGAFKIYV